MGDNEVKYSHHASLRMEQRKIPDHAVNKAIKCGNKVNFGYSGVTAYYNEKVKVIKDNNNIISVVTNQRNVKCDILRYNKKSLKNLEYQVEVRNNDVAMCDLAEIYLCGEFGNKDVKKAFDLFLRASNIGNSHAMCKISDLYRSGIVGKPDEVKANEWLVKAADHGNSYALSVTGQRLLSQYNEKKEGENCDELKKKIMYYLEKGADKGSTRAITTLGFIHEYGLLGDKDINKAIEFYSDAGRAGSPSSLRFLTNLCHQSLFSCEQLEVILNRLIQYLSKSSISMLLELGIDQINKIVGFSPSRGVNMVEAAIIKLKSHEEAIIQLIMCYKHGIGCKKDPQLCQYWYNELFSLYFSSYEQGNVDSLWKLGKFHLEGKVGDIDIEKAEFCFREAVSLSNRMDLKIKLGKMYLEGILGDKDIKIGEDLIKDALKTKVKTALKNDFSECLTLGSIYKNSEYSFSSFEKAHYWFSRASAAGMQEGEYELATLFLDKKSGYTNIRNGLLMLDKLMLNGFIEAYEVIGILKLFLSFEDDEYIQWLKNKSEMKINVYHRKLQSVEQIISNDIYNETEEYLLKENCIKKLARGYYSGEIGGKKNIKLASQYWNILVNEFDLEKNIFALIKNYDELPSSLQSTIKSWAETLPSLIVESTDTQFFSRCLLLSKILLEGKLLTKDVLRSAKFWCIQYFLKDQNITNSLPKKYTSIVEKLKESGRIVEELLQLVEKFKTTSLFLYKILTRILGDVFFEGVIINHDIEKAIHWYCEASKLNNSKASFALAKIYRTTNKKNIYRSLKFYKLAVTQGNQEALCELVEFINENEIFRTHLPFLDNYTHKSRVPHNIIKDIQPYKNLPQYPSNTNEMFDIAMKYLKDKDESKQNLYNAVYWLRKCMKRGHLNSFVELCKIYNSSLLGERVKTIANKIKIKLIKTIKPELNSLLLNSRLRTNKDEKEIETLVSYINVLKECPDNLIFEEVILTLEQCSLSSHIIINNLRKAITACNKIIDEHEQHMLFKEDYSPTIKMMSNDEFEIGSL